MTVRSSLGLMSFVFIANGDVVVREEDEAAGCWMLDARYRYLVVERLVAEAGY